MLPDESGMLENIVSLFCEHIVKNMSEFTHFYLGARCDNFHLAQDWYIAHNIAIAIGIGLVSPARSV